MNKHSKLVSEEMVIDLIRRIVHWESVTDSIQNHTDRMLSLMDKQRIIVERLETIVEDHVGLNFEKRKVPVKSKKKTSIDKMNRNESVKVVHLADRR